MMKKIPLMTSLLILVVIMLLGTSASQGAPGDLEWGTSKGDKYSWEVTSLEKRKDFSIIYSHNPEFLGVEIEKGDKIELKLLSDPPESLVELVDLNYNDYCEIKVAGTEISLDGLGNLANQGYESTIMWAFPIRAETSGVPTFNLKAVITVYASQWEDYIDANALIGVVDVSNSRGKVILDVQINSAQIGNAYRDWNMKQAWEERTGVLYQYQMDQEDVVEYEMERKSDRNGLFGVEAPLIPVIFALAVPAIVGLKARKRV
ncbi:MAG: hypothetical protein ACXAB4_03100 [Candidatus Hodarchaeales archaeon]|jgi:hypothetical protein